MTFVRVVLIGLGCILGACGATVDDSGEGGSGAGGSGGGGVSCRIPDEHVNIAINGAVPATNMDLEGVLTQSGPSTFQLDTCPPTAACEPSALHALTIEVPGLSPSIPNGTFVSVSFAADTFPDDNEQVRIAVRNLPTWYGLSNPTSSEPWLWLFATTGIQDSGLPIEEEVRCWVDAAPGESNDFAGGGGTAEPVNSVTIFDLRVAADNGPDGGPFNVGPGETQTIEYLYGANAGTYEIANVYVVLDYDFHYSQYGVARLVE